MKIEIPDTAEGWNAAGWLRHLTREGMARRWPGGVPESVRRLVEHELNLIGVYGTAGSRRALVRTPTGRFLRVEVGDRLDGGRVAAISETELSYVKNGRTIVLKGSEGETIVSEVAERTGLPKSTVARLLATLVEIGAVEQSDLLD